MDPSWIKNAGQGNRDLPHPYPISISLNPYFRFYLDQVRPLLLRVETNSFWINKKGLPLSTDTCREYVKEVIEKVTDKKLNIRLLRLNVNSHFFNSGPHDPQEQLWWNYLMDHSPETEREYYRVWEREKWGHEAIKHSHPFMVCSCFLGRID